MAGRFYASLLQYLQTQIFHYHLIIFCIRTAFIIAINVTPTSAKTASHKVAIPLAPKISTNNFTPNANNTFCQIIRRVQRPTLIAVATFEGLIGLDDYIRRFNGGIASQSSHSNTHIT